MLTSKNVEYLSTIINAFFEKNGLGYLTFYDPNDKDIIGGYPKNCLYITSKYSIVNNLKKCLKHYGIIDHFDFYNSTYKKHRGHFEDWYEAKIPLLSDFSNKELNELLNNSGIIKWEDFKPGMIFFYRGDYMVISRFPTTNECECITVRQVGFGGIQIFFETVSRKDYEKDKSYFVQKNNNADSKEFIIRAILSGHPKLEVFNYKHI